MYLGMTFGGERQRVMQSRAVEETRRKTTKHDVWGKEYLLGVSIHLLLHIVRVLESCATSFIFFFKSK